MATICLIASSTDRGGNGQRAVRLLFARKMLQLSGIYQNCLDCAKGDAHRSLQENSGTNKTLNKGVCSPIMGKISNHELKAKLW